MMPITFIDLETTGSSPLNDKITEIGLVELDPDGSTRTWQQLIDPERPITPFIEQLTGISDALLAGAPRFETIAPALFARLTGRLFIAHNARFDYSFLVQEFERCGLNFSAQTVCTVKLSRALYPGFTKHNLDSLIERHRLVASGRHRALADADLVFQFWQHIHQEHGADAVMAACRKQAPKPGKPNSDARGVRSTA